MSVQIASKLVQAPVVRLRLVDWQETWRPTMVFGLHFIFGNLFFQIDTILLALWRGDHDVGIYQSVFKIATLALIVPDIAVYTMMPVLSRLHGDDPARWNITGKLLYKMLFLISLPVSMTLFLFPDQIIGILYGAHAFEEAIPILRLFAVIIFVRFGVDAYALMLTTARRQEVRMLIVIVGTVLNVMLNVFAIPAYGPRGAAVVSLVTNIAVAAGYVAFSGMSFRTWSLGGRTLVPFLITVACVVVAWNLPPISVWLALPCITFVFGLVVYGIGLTADEKRLIFGRDQTTVVPIHQ